MTQWIRDTRRPLRQTSRILLTASCSDQVVHPHYPLSAAGQTGNKIFIWTPPAEDFSYGARRNQVSSTVPAVTSVIQGCALALCYFRFAYFKCFQRPNQAPQYLPLTTSSSSNPSGSNISVRVLQYKLWRKTVWPLTLAKYRRIFWKALNKL